MRTYMAKLGTFQFGIDTAAFQSMQRQSKYEWQENKRIGRKPAQQFTGSGADVIMLSGVIFPHYRGGMGQVGAMRALAGSGTALPLIYSFESVGQYCGLWCITAISEGRTVFFDDGRPRRIEFTITMTEYGEDGGGIAGGAMAAVGALAGSVIDITGATSAASSVQFQAQAVTTQAGALSTLGKVVGAATTVADATSATINAITGSPAIRLARTSVQDAGNLMATANSMRTAAAQLKSAGTNPADVLAALTNVSASSSAVSEALSSASNRLGVTATDYNGSSGGSRHEQEVTSASASMFGLSSAAASIRSASDKLRGFF